MKKKVSPSTSFFVHIFHPFNFVFPALFQRYSVIRLIHENMSVEELWFWFKGTKNIITIPTRTTFFSSKRNAAIKAKDKNLMGGESLSHFQLSWTLTHHTTHSFLWLTGPLFYCFLFFLTNKTHFIFDVLQLNCELNST